MARARNIKPGFFKNEYLNTLSMAARLLFAGLWTLADREGRLEDRPLRIKMELFPLDVLDVNDLLNELHDSTGEFIKRYEVEGQKYIQIMNFHKHQNPHHRENPSVIPGMPEKGTAKPEASPEKVRPGRAESLLLNPECGTPTTETSAKEKSSSSGQFFEISLRGQELREDEWLYRCFLEARRSSGKSVSGCDDLKATLSLYPSLYDTYKRWILQPMPVRMAAFVYVHLHKTADDPFRYAIKAAEDGQAWDKMPELLKQTTEMVANKDYKVIING